MIETFDLIVIGAGASGFAAAITAAVIAPTIRFFHHLTLMFFLLSKVQFTPPKNEVILPCTQLAIKPFHHHF